MIDERDVDYEKENQFDFVIEDLNNPKQSTLSKVWNFVRTGTARPYSRSEQDGTSSQSKEKDNKFLVRYMYSPEKYSENSRKFCIKMVEAKKVYRKEDIIAMGDLPVNVGFGEGGSDTYSIWLYKGGARCQHRWLRKTYVTKKDSKSLGKLLTTTEARKRGFRPEANEQQVPVAPKDMPFAGYTEEYWNEKGFTS